MFTSPEVTILLVEDDASVREVIARTLTRSGYTVHERATGEAAIEFVRGHAGPIDLLLVDTVLGGISGIETTEQILEMRPSLPALHMSGYSHTSIFGAAKTTGYAFIAKPFQRQELDQRIRKILAERQATGAAK